MSRSSESRGEGFVCFALSVTENIVAWWSVPLNVIAVGASLYQGFSIVYFGKIYFGRTAPLHPGL